MTDDNRNEGESQTGLDLGAVIEAARQAQSVLGRKLTSHSLVAGPVHWHPAAD